MYFDLFMLVVCEKYYFIIFWYWFIKNKCLLFDKDERKLS